MRKASRPWTDAEVEIVRTQYAVQGRTRLGRLLGRQPQSVYCKAKQLRVRLSSAFRTPLFKGMGEITGQFMSHVRKGAERRGYSFALTVEEIHALWERQGRRCYYSGVPIGFKEKTASLDRLDSTLSYTLDNVVLVHKMVNKMKLGRTHDEFIRLVHQIANHGRCHA